MRNLKQGDQVRFRTFGYEVADVRNPNPAPEAEGIVNGDVVLNSATEGGGYVPLWCERENREPTIIYVALGNIL